MYKKIPIISSVYDIPQRLREIDKDYFVLFNCKTGKFEVHNKGQIGSTLCVTVPYDELDERTVFLVRKTRIENIKKLISEIDRQNEELYKKNFKVKIDEASAKALDMAKYVENKEHLDFLPSDAYSTKFI